MADLSQIKVLDTTYDIKDTTARQGLQGKANTSHTHTKSQITDLVVPTKTSDLTNDSGFIDKATFVATYNTTTFADIASAVEDGYCVKCDMSGYTYELVQATTEKITFAATSNVSGTITQETVWLNSDDTWDSESVNVAKSSDVPSNAVTSENKTIETIQVLNNLPETPNPKALSICNKKMYLGDEMISGDGGGGSGLLLDPNDIYFMYSTKNPVRVDNTTIPSEYTKKTLIKGSGTSSLINTGIFLGDGVMKFEINTKFRAIYGSNSFDQIMGTPWNGDSNNMTRIIFGGSYSNRIICNVDSSGSYSSQIEFTQGNIVCFGRDDGGRFAIKDYATSVLSNNTNGNVDMREFGLFGSSTATISIYHFFMKIAGVCVANYIPCVRNVDNVAGYYDLVTTTFKTSADDGVSLTAE